MTQPLDAKRWLLFGGEGVAGGAGRIFETFVGRGELRKDHDFVTLPLTSPEALQSGRPPGGSKTTAVPRPVLG